MNKLEKANSYIEKNEITSHSFNQLIKGGPFMNSNLVIIIGSSFGSGGQEIGGNWQMN